MTPLGGHSAHRFNISIFSPEKKIVRILKKSVQNEPSKKNLILIWIRSNKCQPPPWKMWKSTRPSFSLIRASEPICTTKFVTQYFIKSPQPCSVSESVNQWMHSFTYRFKKILFSSQISILFNYYKLCEIFDNHTQCHLTHVIDSYLKNFSLLW